MQNTIRESALVYARAAQGLADNYQNESSAFAFHVGLTEKERQSVRYSIIEGENRIKECHSLMGNLAMFIVAQFPELAKRCPLILSGKFWHATTGFDWNAGNAELNEVARVLREAINPPMLTVAEFAEQCGASERAVRNAANDGKIVGTDKSSGQLMIPANSQWKPNKPKQRDGTASAVEIVYRYKCSKCDHLHPTMVNRCKRCGQNSVVKGRA